MKITASWASVALLAPLALADSPTTTSATATSTSATPSCTASLITKLCDYPEPGDEFAVAEDTRGCWNYCNAHPPCSFAIYADSGNPYRDSGTCWLYPGETFDKSKGNSDCGNAYLSVYDKPTCTGGSATTTAGACAATATPSAIAKVCGYPTPPGDCWDDCSASLGAVDCLSQCVESESCSYVVFNPHNDDNTPYSDGTCWMYPNGTYTPSSASKCSGDPEQFVYKNPCPKPSSSASSLASTTTESSSGTGTGASAANLAAAATSTTTVQNKNSAPSGPRAINPFAIGMVPLIWQAL